MDTSTTSTTFKPGDRVRRIERANGTRVPAGSVGNVTKVDDDLFRFVHVKWDNGHENGNFPGNLELVVEIETTATETLANAPEPITYVHFAKGDRLRLKEAHWAVVNGRQKAGDVVVIDRSLGADSMFVTEPTSGYTRGMIMTSPYESDMVEKLDAAPAMAQAFAQAERITDPKADAAADIPAFKVGDRVVRSAHRNFGVTAGTLGTVLEASENGEVRVRWDKVVDGSLEQDYYLAEMDDDRPWFTLAPEAEEVTAEIEAEPKEILLIKFTLDERDGIMLSFDKSKRPTNTGHLARCAVLLRRALADLESMV